MRNEKRVVEWEGGVEDRAGGVGAEGRGRRTKSRKRNECGKGD